MYKNKSLIPKSSLSMAYFDMKNDNVVGMIISFALWIVLVGMFAVGSYKKGWQLSDLTPLQSVLLFGIGITTGAAFTLVGVIQVQSQPVIGGPAQTS